jgi:hypothetical protein
MRLRFKQVVQEQCICGGVVHWYAFRDAAKLVWLRVPFVLVFWYYSNIYSTADNCICAIKKVRTNSEILLMLVLFLVVLQRIISSAERKSWNVYSNALLVAEVSEVFPYLFAFISFSFCFNPFVLVFVNHTVQSPNACLLVVFRKIFITTSKRVIWGITSAFGTKLSKLLKVFWRFGKHCSSHRLVTQQFDLFSLKMN